MTPVMLIICGGTLILIGLAAILAVYFLVRHNSEVATKTGTSWSLAKGMFLNLFLVMLCLCLAFYGFTTGFTLISEGYQQWDSLVQPSGK